MEEEYREWTLRAKAYAAVDRWGALVEIWEPGKRRTHGGSVVPFRKRFNSVEEAQTAGIEAARSRVDQLLV
jgi:hypothetical protein